MTKEEARGVLGDVRAYLASRASLENEMLAGHTFTDICNAIKALEQARWIPVSERLPKPDEFVLVTYKRWGHGDNDLFKDLPEYVYSTYFAYYDIHRGFGNENEDVIAWMPLPEPYKEGDNNEI